MIRGREGATGARSIEVSLLLGAALVLLGFTTACGPDDLPPGIVPGAVVSFERTGSTSGTASTSGSSLAITSFTPTTPTAELAVTVTGRGFGNNAQLLGILHKVPTFIARTIDAQLPVLTPVDVVTAVTTATATSLSFTLAPDFLSGNFAVGVRTTPNTTNGPEQTVSFSRTSNAVAINLTPRITALSGTLTPGQAINLTVTGVSTRLADNIVTFRSATGTDLGNATATSIAFVALQRASLLVSIPSTITTTITRVELQVAGRVSNRFP